MTAVYVISSHDDISAFRENRKAVMRRFGLLTAYIDSVGAPPTVVVTGIDSKELNVALKQFGGDPEPAKVLDAFRKKVSEALLSLDIACGEMRVFIHFGGQDREAVVARNKRLGRLCADDDSFKCYAISFGETTPNELFPSGRFLPPSGADFDKLCKKLYYGKVEDYCHLRALRLLLSAAEFDERGMCDCEKVERSYRDITTDCFGWTVRGKDFEYEREYLCSSEDVRRMLGIKEKGSFVLIPQTLSGVDYRKLMSHLEMKGVYNERAEKQPRE